MIASGGRFFQVGAMGRFYSEDDVKVIAETAAKELAAEAAADAVQPHPKRPKRELSEHPYDADQARERAFIEASRGL